MKIILGIFLIGFICLLNPGIVERYEVKLNAETENGLTITSSHTFWRMLGLLHRQEMPKTLSMLAVRPQLESVNFIEGEFELTKAQILSPSPQVLSVDNNSPKTLKLAARGYYYATFKLPHISLPLSARNSIEVDIQSCTEVCELHTFSGELTYTRIRKIRFITLISMMSV